MHLVRVLRNPVPSTRKENKLDAKKYASTMGKSVLWAGAITTAVIVGFVVLAKTEGIH